MLDKISGLSAFPITPSDAEGSVDETGLRRLLARLAEAEVDSIGLLGSTGTYAYLSREERRRAVTIAAETLGGRVPILVGIGALRTDEAIRLAQDARAAGADAGLLAPVSYTPLTDDEVFRHFEAVAGEGGLPLVIYDNPSTTHFRFSPALIGRIARLPGVVAAKCPAPEPEAAAAGVATLRAAVPADVSVGFSGDWNVTEALIAGGAAWFSVAGGLFPRTCLAITRAVQAGDAAQARALNAELAPLWILFKAHSSLRVVYALADHLGLCRAEPPRPILPLAPEIRAEIFATVRTLSLA
ncbi:dihydrodipicolinate synthase family protein [Methylobacterium pseudosasicola]|uniref:4-hydroxy-tetrahydrodipicolinate synthase n=1 Tax=Methylobacterium pseudosasicola TaxID=582667 RepID=A0A1I4KD54_9HYPH|nr:dihydrodipicolinate synthase family protein [Methylobacterium pseudosasicola]SFL76541.1 4-hydroxy-tetrahydrodipicolinate synthase [Methylobacterium pseudosasicola]